MQVKPVIFSHSHKIPYSPLPLQHSRDVQFCVMELLAQTVCEAWIFKMFVILLTLHKDVVCVQLIPFFFPIKDSLRLIVPVRAAKMDF